MVIGQYEGYTDDPTVAKSSNTPTFASLALRINNERWDGMHDLANQRLSCSSSFFFL